MAVAERLGKFEHEVLALSPDELARWFAFFRIQARLEEQARKKAARK